MAQDDLKELEKTIDSLRSSGEIKKGVLAKYVGILNEIKDKMKGTVTRIRSHIGTDAASKNV